MILNHFTPLSLTRTQQPGRVDRFYQVMQKEIYSQKVLRLIGVQLEYAVEWWYAGGVGRLLSGHGAIVLYRPVSGLIFSSGHCVG